MTLKFTKKVCSLVVTFFAFFVIAIPIYSQTTDFHIFDPSPYNSTESIESDLLWTFTIYFHSSNEEQKSEILHQIKNPKLLNALDVTSTRNSILNIAFEFLDEKMLLIYLLNEKSVEEKNSQLNLFYSNYSSNTVLFKVNKAISKNEKLDLHEIDFTLFPSVYFYLLEYNQFSNVIDSEIYSHIINFHKTEYKDLKLTTIENELYLASLFYAYYSVDQFGPIEDIYHQMINFEVFPVSQSKRNLFWSLDYVMYSRGYLDRSLEIQREFSLPLSDYLGDESGLHAIYSSHGGYLYILGKYREAREVFESTLRRSDNLSDQNLTRLYNNLSLVYFKTGESGRYVDTQLKALEHSQTYDNYDHQISIYRNLHIFYRKNQNFELARKYINEAYNLAQRIDNKEDLISILISKSVFETDYLQDIHQADIYLTEAEQLLSEDTVGRFRTRILSSRADILMEQQLYEEGLEVQKEIAELALNQNNSTLYLEKLVQKSELNILLGNYSQAEKLLRNFRSHDITVVDFTILTLSRMLQAKLYHYNGEFSKAKELFSETTNMVLERARYSADHETGYWTIEREYMQLFETYADFLIERSMYEEAVQLLDRVKTINDTSLLQNPLITSTQLTEEQLSRDRQITREMETLRRRLFTASGNDRLQLNSQLERLQAQKKELFQHQRVSPEEQREFPLWSIRRTLASDQILIHITSINENYYLSKITRNNTEIQKITIDEERRDIIESAIQGMISGRTDLRKLYQIGQLFHLHDISDNFSSAILMPDGFLHQLPIDVIPINEPATSNSYGATTFLIEKVDVRTLNRLSDIRKQHQNRKFDYDFTGFGVADFQNAATQRTLMPLPKAPGEVTTVSNNLNRFTNKTTFLESDATPRKFKEIAGKSRILHMATHSEISESDPLFSRLHLMPEIDSENSDNQIFAYELFELDLQNELIMLNSCESGGDRAIQGSGIMGLSRALHYAGAQSLVLNAWSVNDQFAAEFAEVFYQYINDGESKSRALQLTKIDFLRYKNANPHFWGPYILNGNNQPLIQKKNANLGNWIIALIFIAGFIAVSRSRQPAAA